MRFSVFRLVVSDHNGITGRSPTSSYRKLFKSSKYYCTARHILRQQDSSRRFEDGFLGWRWGAGGAVPTLSSSSCVILAPDYEYLTVYFTPTPIASIAGFSKDVFAIATYLLSTWTVKPAATTTVTFLRLFSVIIRGPPSLGSNQKPFYKDVARHFSNSIYIHDWSWNDRDSDTERVPIWTINTSNCPWA